MVYGPAEGIVVRCRPRVVVRIFSKFSSQMEGGKAWGDSTLLKGEGWRAWLTADIQLPEFPVEVR